MINKKRKIIFEIILIFRIKLYHNVIRCINNSIPWGTDAVVAQQRTDEMLSVNSECFKEWNEGFSTLCWFTVLFKHFDSKKFNSKFKKVLRNE